MRLLRLFCVITLILATVACDKRTQLEVQRLEERIAELELRVRENEARLYRQLEAKVAGEPVRREPSESSENRAEERTSGSSGAPEEEVALPAPEPEPMVVPVPEGDPEPEVSSSDHSELSTMTEPSPESELPPLPLGEVRALYSRSYEAITSGRHDEAERGFRRILDHHPDHELAPNALYWLGEVSYSQYNFNHASVLFARVVERYPESSKVPDAMLKRAMSRDRLGLLEEAVEDYRRLIERFPESRAAELAKRRL